MLALAAIMAKGFGWIGLSPSDQRTLGSAALRQPATPPDAEGGTPPCQNPAITL